MLDTPNLRQRITQKETERFILRVMVALVILYDHIHPTGAFAKGSLNKHILKVKKKLTYYYAKSKSMYVIIKLI